MSGPVHHSSGRSGRWFLAIIGIWVACAGGVFIWLMARSFARALEMRSWAEVSCVILTAETKERRNDEFSAPEFRQAVSFGYEWKGVPHTGSHLTLRGNPWSADRQSIEQKNSALPPGSTTTCHVNPANPDFAVLQPDSLAPLYAIWFPAVFVVGGLGMAVRAVKSRPQHQRLNRQLL